MNSNVLEAGFVYVPYVPMMTTPTIFMGPPHIEQLEMFDSNGCALIHLPDTSVVSIPHDFTARKGIMTRYGKKMTKSEMYGTLTLKE